MNRWWIWALAVACATCGGRAAERTGPAAALGREVADKGWIVYNARSDKGDYDLFLCRPDGSSVRNITRTPGESEFGALFSRDGAQLLYRSVPRDEVLDNNAHGTQGRLMIAASDGTNPRALGEAGQFPWASWSPDGKQIASLTIKGIQLVDVASRKVVRTLPRQGFFQQMIWSPDGKSLVGVSNNLGTAWSIGRLDIATGKVNAVSKVNCCTPDWFSDGSAVIFSKWPDQWTQLWMAQPDGQSPRLIYAEHGRHVYGGHVSPDGKYVLFTGNMNEDGDPGKAGAPMALMRLVDAPILGGDVSKLQREHPRFRPGPVLVLPDGWEPCWTYSERPAGDKTSPAAPAATPGPDAADSGLARELHGQGWIVFSAKTDAGDWDLFICRPDGSDRRALTSTKDFNEAGARFSPDSKRLLYYRMAKDEPLDNNTYGTFDLVIADASGANAAVLGSEYKWACWSGNGRQIACLAGSSIRIVDVANRKTVRELPRKGIVQQLGWSSDSKWFTGTANGLGPYWNIARMDARTGQVNAVSETDRYSCTPDWMNDSERLIYSRGIIPDRGGFAELWIAGGDGKPRSVVYAEDKRHVYGGCISPDGRHVLFTRSEADLGKVDNSRTSMSIIRLADAPVVVGDTTELRSRFPTARSGPRVDLSWGWEPHWTKADVAAEGKR
jgi:Tol biopolymer transport system component